MPIEGMIKRIRNVMRQDEGIGGDAQRIEQIVWLLFLKIFDDQEKIRELENLSYSSPFPENIRWRNWASDKEGITGEELLSFVNTTLFPTLKKLETEREDALFVREMFSEAYNYMKSGTLLRQVINEINEIDFTKNKDRHHLNDIYETILKGLQNAGSYGEFYTPRPLTKFIIETLDPKIGETLFDPACGTGGFLINALEYLKETKEKTTEDRKKIHESIRGCEIKHLPYLLASTNLILHGVEIPDNIKHDDMLAKSYQEYTAKDRVDIIVANPPFGGAVKDGVEQNFPADFRTKATELLFLFLFVHLLRDGGRAGIVLPDGVLFAEGVATRIKKHLLETCNLHTIVRLPQGVFSPYAGVNTNLLFFTKGEPTKEIWYYKLPLPKDLKTQYTKNRGITDEEFTPLKKWWNDRKENEYAWKVSREEIEKKDFNLDSKHPASAQTEIHREPKEILEGIEEREKEIMKLVEELKKEI
ncbi:MAG: SAM-dependent DNA methyltransferase [Candidatus Moraniibacteriota bacterium]|nr:MAG: SAM-dependent DNA methyltransferase [Candidatus Moranbacteria bacterium]